MVVVDLRHTPWQEADVNHELERHGIIGNTTTLPRRSGDASSLGLRLGSTPMSIRGLNVEGYAEVAKCVATLINRGPGASLDKGLQRRMKQIARAHPIPFG
jgi:glycine/serine hydroxymethyltransferase